LSEGIPDNLHIMSKLRSCLMSHQWT